GSNFASGAKVMFGSVQSASVTVGGSTSVTAVAPAQSAAGAVNVQVINPDGQSAVLASGFSYAASPTVSSVSPNSGPASGGTAISIAGTNFVSGATVKVGGVAATGVSVVSATQVSAVAPAHAAGAVAVTVTNPDTQ